MKNIESTTSIPTELEEIGRGTASIDEHVQHVAGRVPNKTLGPNDQAKDAPSSN